MVVSTTLLGPVYRCCFLCTFDTISQCALETRRYDYLPQVVSKYCSSKGASPKLLYVRDFSKLLHATSPERASNATKEPPS